MWVRHSSWASISRRTDLLTVCWNSHRIVYSTAWASFKFSIAIVVLGTLSRLSFCANTEPAFTLHGQLACIRLQWEQEGSAARCQWKPQTEGKRLRRNREPEFWNPLLCGHLCLLRWQTAGCNSLNSTNERTTRRAALLHTPARNSLAF